MVGRVCRRRQRTAVNPSSLQVYMKPAAGSATVGRQLSWELLTEGRQIHAAGISHLLKNLTAA